MNELERALAAIEDLRLVIKIQNEALASQEHFISYQEWQLEQHRFRIKSILDEQRKISKDGIEKEMAMQKGDLTERQIEYIETRAIACNSEVQWDLPFFMNGEDLFAVVQISKHQNPYIMIALKYHTMILDRHHYSLLRYVDFGEDNATESV